MPYRPRKKSEFIQTIFERDGDGRIKKGNAMVTIAVTMLANDCMARLEERTLYMMSNIGNRLNTEA
ncbi:MAG TPA: hypothetical protein DDZ40_12515 [Deltaproteobacteria bacterium]|nr:hypothetical protein [Deltaproteobacteria bacterium]